MAKPDGSVVVASTYVGVCPMRYGDVALHWTFVKLTSAPTVNQGILGGSDRKMPWSGNFAIERNAGHFLGQRYIWMPVPS